MVIARHDGLNWPLISLVGVVSVILLAWQLQILLAEQPELPLEGGGPKQPPPSDASPRPGQPVPKPQPSDNHPWHEDTQWWVK